MNQVSSPVDSYPNGRCPSLGEVGRQLVGDARLVLDRLPLDAGQRGPLLLGLDDTDGLAVDEQHVVGRPGGGYQLPDGDALARVEIDALVVLTTHPARVNMSSIRTRALFSGAM